MIIIFGATGDLTKRKLIPALYNLYHKQILKDNIPILCVSRRPITKDRFIELLNIQEFIPDADQKVLSKFLKLINYFQLDFTEKERCPDFASFIDKIDKEYGCGGNRIFYLATYPGLFKSVVEILQSCRLLEDKGYKRVVFEKPFGHDLSSARRLNECIRSVFKEREIYRIDHLKAMGANGFYPRI